MTVSSTANKITYAGDGSTTNFPFTFSTPAVSTDIEVYFTDASGNISLLSPSVYTLTINPTVSPNPTPIGGTVVYNPSSVPIPLGTQLTILRTLPETQGTSFNNQGALYPQVTEQSLDGLTMMVQQLQELLGRQITVAVSDPTPTALPPAAQRANLIMGFDSLGNPIATAPGGASSPVSSAMAPVVAASTIAGALALLGLTGVTPLPTGMLAPFAGAAPSGWLLAAGQAVSRTGATAALFAYCGTQFGTGDGSTTFNLPDLRGRVPAGIDNMNGIAAGRLTVTTIPNGGGPTVMGGNGGTETNLVTVGKMPSHSHTFTGTPLGTHTHSTSGDPATGHTSSAGANFLESNSAGSSVATDAQSAGTPAGTNSSTGGGAPLEIVQPTICMNWCIKI